MNRPIIDPHLDKMSSKERHLFQPPLAIASPLSSLFSKNKFVMGSLFSVAPMSAITLNFVFNWYLHGHVSPRPAWKVLTVFFVGRGLPKVSNPKCPAWTMTFLYKRCIPSKSTAWCSAKDTSTKSARRESEEPKRQFQFSFPIAYPDSSFHRSVSNHIAT